MPYVVQNAPFESVHDTGVADDVGIFSVQIIESDTGNVVYGPSTANVEETPALSGVYTVQLVAPAAIGLYSVIGSTDGSFAPTTVSVDDLVVVSADATPIPPIEPPAPGAGPPLGPNVPWISGQDVANCCNVAVGTDLSVFDEVIWASSELLYELSGRQFSGLGQQTVRPCADGCGCWAWLTWPASPGVPQFPYGLTWGWWGNSGWGWGYEGCNDVCGCGSLSRAWLPGFPVNAIIQVLIDGAVIGPAEYRLDNWRFLTRLADPVTQEEQFWPRCQRLDLALTEPGTWGVTYTFGQSPPTLGVMAAAQLACELYKVCAGQQCALPVGTTRIDRQGITVERPPFLSWALQSGRWATGLTLVDAFLSAYNPAAHRRPPSVWSPDLPQFAERLGPGSGH
jgi:hypothetical protein